MTTVRVFWLLAFVLAGLAACGRDAPVESTAAIEESDLPDILLQPGEEPDGVSFLAAASGPLDAATLGSELAPNAQEWPPAGYQTAYQHVFAMPAPEDPQSFPPEDVRGVISLSILFTDADSASAFLDTRFPPHFRLESPGFDSVGEERRGLRTEATADRPVQTTLIWRQANLYLQLNVFGDYPIDEVTRLAGAVDNRAATRG